MKEAAHPVTRLMDIVDGFICHSLRTHSYTGDNRLQASLCMCHTVSPSRLACCLQALTQLLRVIEGLSQHWGSTSERCSRAYPAAMRAWKPKFLCRPLLSDMSVSSRGPALLLPYQDRQRCCNEVLME